jgi:hypothetical protein
MVVVAFVVVCGFVFRGAAVSTTENRLGCARAHETLLARRHIYFRTLSIACHTLEW